MKNERDFIFPACRQKTAIWFSTPLAGPSDSAEIYSGISCVRNIIPQDTEVTCFQRDPSDQQITCWKEKEAQDKGRQWQKQANGDQMYECPWEEQWQGTWAQQQRQLSGMSSVWQIPAWPPLLVPVLCCHTQVAGAFPSWREGYQAIQGLWLFKGMNDLESLSAPLAWTQTCSHRRQAVIPKWLQADRPIPRENLMLSARSSMPEPAHLLSRCIVYIRCWVFFYHETFLLEGDLDSWNASRVGKLLMSRWGVRNKAPACPWRHPPVQDAGYHTIIQWLT